MDKYWGQRYEELFRIQNSKFKIVNSVRYKEIKLCVIRA